LGTSVNEKTSEFFVHVRMLSPQSGKFRLAGSKNKLNIKFSEVSFLSRNNCLELQSLKWLV
jgi:hypothetical protein